MTLALHDTYDARDQWIGRIIRRIEAWLFTVPDYSGLDDLEIMTPEQIARSNIQQALEYHDAEIDARLRSKADRAERLKQAIAAVKEADAKDDAEIDQHREARALYQPVAALPAPAKRRKAG